ncbi:hypothetical protein NEOLEDRAFT_146402 [Neolentinus lepideus HHB14362 ss-1]|uniref:Uncharacterized protein n=1 Tax=Neolentinus lepideus HHB14362 ss-1 TaxID=1314782 RepID=A0A165MP42_9AGAM|nr:hypothetical protein NEOLEDRAFT_146402 [Neolentinus lepideus HHB14362 ss-1]
MPCSQGPHSMLGPVITVVVVVVVGIAKTWVPSVRRMIVRKCMTVVFSGLIGSHHCRHKNVALVTRSPSICCQISQLFTCWWGTAVKAHNLKRAPPVPLAPISTVVHGIPQWLAMMLIL